MHQFWTWNNITIRESKTRTEPTILSSRNVPSKEIKVKEVRRNSEKQNELLSKRESNRALIENSNSKQITRVQFDELELEEKSCTFGSETFGFPFLEWPGFGYQMKNLISAAINAFFYNRTIVIDDEKWNYGKWLYLFKCPLPHCELPNANRDPEYNRPRYYKINATLTEMWTRGTPWIPVFNLQVPELQHLYTMLEGQRATIPCLWRLGRKAEKAANDALEEMFGKKLNIDASQLSYPFKYNYSEGDNPYYYGIHVRRGDKLVHEAKYVPVMKHIEIIEHFYKLENSRKSKYQNSQKRSLKMPKVFVTSDDMVSTLQDLRVLRPSWDFIFRKSAENSSGHNQYVFNALPLRERVAKAIELLVDIEIIRRAKFVACSASSHICGLIQVLRYAPANTLLTVYDRVEMMMKK